MKVVQVMGLLLASCLLAGCFEGSQDLVVEEDGSATFQTRMAMEASLMQMADDDDFCSEEDTPVMEGISLEHETFTENDMAVCLITASGPIDRLAEWMEEASHSPGGDSDEMMEAPTVTLKREGSDYVFSVLIESSPLDLGGDDPMMEEMKPMLMAAFAGRSLGWSVSAPEILETNGELSEDGQTASYSIPLANLMDEAASDRTFEVRFALASSPGLLRRLLGN